ncbi:hypothetical protein DH2020_020346 [Rehmannia glutinosa]|uniref:Uncharacterized protein n=1 Tax=Rehmannia glutinosa TaxID=99300 RepID=A0ABR0WFY9_REHGL
MASNYDEIFMHHTLHFQDSLKDLKNLRKQLYSAAEYFESSYDKEDGQQEFMIESSKDYVAKALVSTVDHLGSVADKLNKFLDEKTNEFSATNIRFSCIEQRSGSVANRSVSPSPAHYKPRSPSEPRRAISEHTKPEMRNRESEIEPYTRRSKNLFKALLNVHRSRKENHTLQMTQKW